MVGRLHLDGGGERLLVLEDRKIQGADDDALVRDADAHGARQVVLREEPLDRLGQLGRVDDLAVAQDAGPQLGDRAALEGDRAVHADFGGGDMARVELEPDDVGLGGALLEHGFSIGTVGPCLEGQDEAVISRNVFCTMPAVPNALMLLNTFGSQMMLTLLDPA